MALDLKTLPQYFYDKKENKIVKVQSDNTLVYFQIKQYSTGEISHSYGKKILPPLNYLEAMLENYEVSNEAKYKEVIASYYNKEMENFKLVRKHLFNR